MATLSTYTTLLNQKLGRSTTNFWTPEMKTQAINNAVSDVLEEYAPPSHVRRGTLTFASGKVAKPADYFRMVKLWDNTTKVEFEYIVEDEFDDLSATSSGYWTEDYDTTDDTRKLFIRPTTQTATNIRYVKSPLVLSAGTDESGLETEWSEAVAHMSASALFANAGETESFQLHEQLGRQQRAKAWLAIKKRGGVKQGERLRSKYERVSQLNKRRTL